MKKSIGYTLTFNIMIIFIIIVFTFISSALVYYKSHKATNALVGAIDQYEGYNSQSIKEIDRNLGNIGYNVNNINCTGAVDDDDLTCNLVTDSAGRGSKGYCVYLCDEPRNDYYYYKVRINMMINIPIINDILDIPIYSNSSRLYDFEFKKGKSDV